MRSTFSDLEVRLADEDARVFPEMRRQPRHESAAGGAGWAHRGSTDVLTIQDVSAYLRLPVSTVYRLARRGELPGHKVGRHWRFHWKTLEGWFGHRHGRRAPREDLGEGSGGQIVSPGLGAGQHRHRVARAS